MDGQSLVEKIRGCIWKHPTTQGPQTLPQPWAPVSLHVPHSHLGLSHLRLSLCTDGSPCLSSGSFLSFGLTEAEMTSNLPLWGQRPWEAWDGGCTMGLTGGLSWSPPPVPSNCTGSAPPLLLSPARPCLGPLHLLASPAPGALQGHPLLSTQGVTSSCLDPVPRHLVVAVPRGPITTQIVFY